MSELRVIHATITVFFSQYLDDFNMSSSKEMKLVFFMDAIEHVSRFVCLNELLQQWCTKVCAFLNGGNFFSFESSQPPTSLHPKGVLCIKTLFFRLVGQR